MKILLVNKYWRSVGGVENHAFAVRDLLVSLGHEVIPFAMSEQETLPNQFTDYYPSSVDFRADGLRATARALNRAVVSAESTRNLRRLISREKPDAAYVLHVYHQLGTAILNVLARQNIPTVLSLHDYKISCGNYRFFSERTSEICTKCLDHRTGFLWAPTTEGCWGGSRAAGAALTLEAMATKARRSYHKADVITTLNSLQERAITEQGIKVPLVRVPHPVDLKDRRQVRDRSYFLFLGRIVPEKGLENLIRACHSAGTELRVIGDGRSADSARRLANELDARVEFLGSIPHADIDQHLEGAIALTVPSAWHEVSPLVVYEAIARDVPVIASDVGGMVDQLGDNRGYLLPPSDLNAWAATMANVAMNQHEAQLRSLRARDHVATFQRQEDWQRCLMSAFAQAGVNI